MVDKDARVETAEMTDELVALIMGIIEKFSEKKVVVIGDVMIDHYVFGRTRRISQEAPVPIIEYQNQRYGLGGAANAALNLKLLGADVTLSGVYGNDQYGRYLGERLDEVGITNACRSVDWENGTHRFLTIMKQRIISNGQQICRVDNEQDPEEYGKFPTVFHIHFPLDSMEIDAIFISDYSKGTVTDELMESVRKSGVPFYCDPKSTDLRKYGEAAGITPNVQEAEGFQYGMFDSCRGTFLEAVEILGIKSVLITKGADGVSFWDSSMKGPMEIPGHRRLLKDACGAGDTAFAVYGLSKLCGASTCTAAFLANLAGAVVVQKPGVVPVTGLDLVHALNGETSEDG